MGHDRLWTAAVNVSSGGIERMGSNPSSEMGASVKGEEQRRMRASRRGSRKAISVGDGESPTAVDELVLDDASVASTGTRRRTNLG